MKQHKHPSKVSLGLSISFSALLLLASCSVLHPLPGLCYTDKTGTYLCKTSNENMPATVNNPVGPTSREVELVCMEEQDHGVFIDVCKGVVIIPINIEYE